MEKWIPLRQSVQLVSFPSLFGIYRRKLEEGNIKRGKWKFQSTLHLNWRAYGLNDSPHFQTHLLIAISQYFKLLLLCLK